jgi:bifunctional non-homologous end joining protein LigD
VGAGWDADEARLLRSRLQKLVIDAAPYEVNGKPGRWLRRAAEAPRWVKPTLVAEVTFSQWTPDGQIRHASYVALRTDKPAAAVVRESPQHTGSPAMRGSSKKAAGAINVTHADRIIDASTGLRKIDLVRYYESVADWLLPHLKGRPCSLVRAPAGVDGKQFFQKHGGIGIEHVKQLDASLWPGHQPLLEIDSRKALASAAQMNVIEFHTWNSRSTNIDKPDRMVLDLDPGTGTPWNQVQEAAMLTRVLLQELGLKSWLKTSGGKGLHVVVPLAPRLDYHTVKNFSKALVQHLARTIPSRFVARSGPSNRVGKIFVDYLRNGMGATTVTAFSARARPGLGVSMPLSWDALPSVNSAAQWTIGNAVEHLAAQRRDPWAGYWKQSQTLTAAMQVLSFNARHRTG